MHFSDQSVRPQSSLMSSGVLPSPAVFQPSPHSGVKGRRTHRTDHMSSYVAQPTLQQLNGVSLSLSSLTATHLTASSEVMKVPFLVTSSDEDSSDNSFWDEFSSDDDDTPLSVNRTVIKYSNGCIYTGEHDGNNVPHGKGLMTWADDSYYSGDWCMGQRHGVGTMSWASAKKSYHGSFKMGAMHGSGKMYDETHQLLLQGLWLDNVHVHAS